MIDPEHLNHKDLIIDVRTPAEFKQGHIPGAYNLPVFSNAERHQIGWSYKNEGPQDAIHLGLQFVGPKLQHLVRDACRIAPDRRVQLYCWRGGMRSESVQWLLELSGFECERLRGGYKAYRNWALQCIDQPKALLVLGGLTGVGKTDVLAELKVMGEQCVDLESIANHRGSAFGGIGVQPTNEQFENNLAYELNLLNPNRWTWIEDESKLIGKIVIPKSIRERIEQAPMIQLERPLEQRVQHLCQLYGQIPTEALIASFDKIKKRIGDQSYRQAIDGLLQNELETPCRIALGYYDKSYAHGMQRNGRKPQLRIDVSKSSPVEVVSQLISWSQSNSPNSQPNPAVAVK